MYFTFLSFSALLSARNTVRSLSLLHLGVACPEVPTLIHAVHSSFCRYLDNIYLHPEEEKYRKIKLQNKVFQVRSRLLQVLCLGKSLPGADYI